MRHNSRQREQQPRWHILAQPKRRWPIGLTVCAMWWDIVVGGALLYALLLRILS